MPMVELVIILYSIDRCSSFETKQKFLFCTFKLKKIIKSKTMTIFKNESSSF